MRRPATAERSHAVVRATMADGVSPVLAPLRFPQARPTFDQNPQESIAVKSAVETVNPTRVKLTVEVPFDELKPSLDAAYKSIANQVAVPGFRKGKVPPRVIDQRFGRGAVIEEAVNDALPRFYLQAVEAEEVRPLG